MKVSENFRKSQFRDPRACEWKERYSWLDVVLLKPRHFKLQPGLSLHCFTTRRIHDEKERGDEASACHVGASRRWSE